MSKRNVEKNIETKVSEEVLLMLRTMTRGVKYAGRSRIRARARKPAAPVDPWSRCENIPEHVFPTHCCDVEV